MKDPVHGIEAERVVRSLAPASPALTMTSLCAALALYYFQLVLDAERPEQLACAHAGDLLVHGAVYRAVERDMAIVDDDADRARRIDRVLAQCRIAIDGA